MLVPCVAEVDKGAIRERCLVFFVLLCRGHNVLDVGLDSHLRFYRKMTGDDRHAMYALVFNECAIKKRPLYRLYNQLKRQEDRIWFCRNYGELSNMCATHISLFLSVPENGGIYSAQSNR